MSRALHLSSVAAGGGEGGREKVGVVAGMSGGRTRGRDPIPELQKASLTQAAPAPRLVSPGAESAEGSSGCPPLWALVTLRLPPQGLRWVPQFACPRRPLAVTMATTAGQPTSLPPTWRTSRQRRRGTTGFPAGWSGSPGGEGSGREQRSAPKVLPSDGPKGSRRPAGRAAFGSGPHPVQTPARCAGLHGPLPTSRPPGFSTALLVTACVMSGNPLKLSELLRTPL